MDDYIKQAAANSSDSRQTNEIKVEKVINAQSPQILSQSPKNGKELDELEAELDQQLLNKTVE